ncbi:MAG TPA: cyclic nucleotide-binding domain-containing protein [Anaerolineales bacterium]|nr:cyclic nucleotide-binding domain-containing protein [Anaerolineales bacterium]
MASEWHSALAGRLAQDAAAGRTPESASADVWELIKGRSNLAGKKPEANPAVITRELRDRQGPYFVLKNPQKKTYLRLSPAEHRLWTQMDGHTSMEELIVEHFMATGVFAHSLIAHLVDQLYRNWMLSDEPLAVWDQVNQAVQKRSWSYRLSAPARIFLTQKLSIRNLDRIIVAAYKYGGWLAFTPPAKILLAMLSLAGLVAFYHVLNDPQYVFLGQDIVPGLALLWVAAILPVLIHELGHALTVKHFGREVPGGGLMLYFGMPAAYVETTDIWLEPRRARLAVTWNGPYTGLILGGLAALLIALFPAQSYNNFLFKMAGFAYFTVFINVNPLLKLDGYYLLSDLLDVTSLREKSILFVRKKLFGKVLARQRFSRDEWIYTIFGLLSILWTAYALYIAFFFWRTRFRESLKLILGPGYPLFARALSLLLVAAISSFAILMLLNLVRLARTLLSRLEKSGNLQRHWRLAGIGGGLALAAGLGLPLALPNPVGWVFALFSLLLGALASWQMLAFARQYLGAPRGYALVTFALAIGLAGFSNGIGLLDRSLPLAASKAAAAFEAAAVWLQVVGLGGLLLGGLLMVWNPFRRLRARFLLLGGLAGGIWFTLVATFAGVPSANLSLILTSILVMVTSWDLIALRGSARGPAIALIHVGGLCIGIAWFLSLPRGDFAIVGTLVVAAGGLHLVHARLPELSSYERGELSSQTQQVIGQSVAVLIRRLIAQVFFESGHLGVQRLGAAFSSEMQKNGLRLSIAGNHFDDQELSRRSAAELTDVYGLAFDVLHNLISWELGREMARLTFGYALDQLSWQNREVIGELILSRRPWGLALNQQFEDTRSTSRKALKRVPLFATCSAGELDRVLSGMKKERFAAGDLILQQGEAGDKFYIVEKGNLSVYQSGPDGVEREVDRKGPGQYFGEIALVTGAPRNATVRAATPSILLSLDREDFNRLVRQYISLAEQVDNDVRYSWLLRGMPIFDELEIHEFELLVAILEPETYQAGEVVFCEGDWGDKFYIVEKGEVVITRQVNGTAVELSRQGPGEYFGEVALLHNRPRTATVTATRETKLLALDGNYFLNLISNFSQLGQVITRTGTRRLSFFQRAGASI